jgi:GTPase KRas protein
MSKGVLTKDFKKAYIQLYIHKHEKMRETEKKGMTFFEALNQEEEDVKITLLGDACVGKSAIAIRLISDQYFSEYDPTIEDTYSKDFKIDNTNYVLNILDTSGMDDYESLRGNWISGSQAYIIVFDLTNRQTFDRIEEWVDRVHKYRGKNEARRTAPIVIVGAKSDLTDERVIAPLEAETLALTVGAKYVESSAKTRTNIEEIFFAALRRTSEEQDPDVFSLLTSLGKGVDIVASSRKNSKEKDCIVM